MEDVQTDPYQDNESTHSSHQEALHQFRTDPQTQEIGDSTEDESIHDMEDEWLIQATVDKQLLRELAAADIEPVKERAKGSNIKVDSKRNAKVIKRIVDQHQRIASPQRRVPILRIPKSSVLAKRRPNFRFDVETRTFSRRPTGCGQSSTNTKEQQEVKEGMRSGTRVRYPAFKHAQEEEKL